MRFFPEDVSQRKKNTLRTATCAPNAPEMGSMVHGRQCFFRALTMGHGSVPPTDRFYLCRRPTVRVRMPCMPRIGIACSITDRQVQSFLYLVLFSWSVWDLLLHSPPHRCAFWSYTLVPVLAEIMVGELHVLTSRTCDPGCSVWDHVVSADKAIADLD